jgi:hypothetical protein
MLLQIILNGKTFVTNITFKWKHFTMHVLIMFLHITLRSKCFFTHITAIWTTTTVYALMLLLLTALITVGLTVYTAWKRTPSSMQTLMLFQISLTIE